MKQKYYILALVVLTVCLALFAACDTQTVEPPVQYDLSFSVDGVIYRTQQVSGNQSVALPEAPDKEGYLFNGWFFDEGAWTQLFYADAFADKPITGDVTVYAKYTPIKYAITYEPQGVMHDNASHYTLEQELTLQPATKEHYDFVGWFADAEYTQPVTEIALGSTGNLTLYAKFAPTEYKATFMDGENVVAKVPYTVESERITAPEVPEHAGYVGAWEYFELTPGGITVNAKYTAIDYKITYEGVKASEHNNPAGYNATQQPIALEAAERQHYLFAGWYTDAEFTNRIGEISAGMTGDLTLYARFIPIVYKIVFMDGETFVGEVEFTIETESITAPEVPEHAGFVGEWESYELKLSCFTVNAKYTAIDYKITYEGAAPEEFENPAGYNVTQQPIALQGAQREHYIFDGWYTEPEYTNLVTEIAAGTIGDLVLYAKWTPVEYKVTFMDGETVVAEVPYTVETDPEAFIAPEVPEHPGYAGVWEEFELTLEDKTVNAVYTLINYTIVYENVKDAQNSNPSTYTVIDETIVLADLSKPGYVFNGWYVGDTRVTEIAAGSTGDLVLTAAWTPIEYSIKLHFDPAWGKYADAINPSIYTVEDAIVLIDLVCKIPGYVFDGWYTEKNLGDGEKVTELAGAIGDLELYAHFVPKQYTITYVGVEGATHINPGVYTIESEALHLLPAMKDGYIFGGWYIDEALSVPASLLIPKGSMGDITLYTKWTPITYTIEYDADGGVLPENPVTYNITQTLSLQAPTRAGYVFQGWFTEKEDGEQEGEQITQIVPGMSGNLKLYARWQPIYYSITYHLYGGENPQMNLPLYTIELPTVLLLPATKPGYKFEGWYADPAYTERVLMIEQGSTGNITLYAKWSLATYEITYVLPEGATHDNVTSYTILDEIKPLNPATLKGWTFDGWYKDESFTYAVTQLPITGEDGDLTLYAKFVPKQYYIWMETQETDSFIVVFNYNCGSEQLLTQTVTIEHGLEFPEIPVREGYLFAGWYDNAECTGAPFDFSVPVMSDITLYAKWVAVTAFITINTPVDVALNGVTEQKFTFVSMANTVITIATEGELDTRGFLYDAQGNVLVQNDDASGTNKNFRMTYYVTAGQVYTVSVSCYSEVAQGTVKLSVTGDATVPAGGKAFLPNMRVVNSGESFKLPVPEARPLYKFLGWADEEGNMYTDSRGNSLKAWDRDADIVLYEVWEEMYYDVSFNTVGGSAINSFKLYTGEVLDVTKLVPEKAGYRFLGWMLDGAAFTNGIMPDHGVTLTAVWQEIIYTVKYENTKDIAHGNAVVYTVNSDTITLAELSVVGYKFEGWYAGNVRVTEIPAGSTGNLVLTAVWTPVEYKITFMDGETVVAEIPYTIETESITAPQVPVHVGYTGEWEQYKLTLGGVTVNAVYTLIDYTIVYENVKDVANSNPITYTVVDQTIVLTDLSKLGYVFEGWYVGDVRVTEIPAGSTGDLVLTAVWTPVEYKLNLNFDPAWGKYAEATNPSTYTVEDAFELIGLECLIPGYVFDGWYTEKNPGESEKVTEMLAGTTGDVTLYARFVLQRYTITYVGAEGAVNKNPVEYTIESEALYIVPAKKVGYAFGGWFLDEQLSVPASLLIPTGSMGDITLYTKWTPITYSITYDANGGVLPENPAVYNTTQTLTLEVPTKAGYVFLGWYVQAGKDPSAEDKQITQILPGMSGDLKLYARWEVIYYSITYHLNGGENSQLNLPLYTVEQKTMKLQLATKPGYKFEGWYTDPAFTKQATEIEQGTIGDIVLYAKWSLATYSVDYVLPDGAEHTNPDRYTIFDELEDLNPASLTGYVFEGWYKDEDYTIAIKHLLGSGEYSDLVLYAKFVPKQYNVWLGTDEDNSHSVIFDLNGGKGEAFAQTVTVSQGLTYPEIPVRDGYLFAGWYDNAECTGVAFDMSAPVMGDTVLYAKWIAAEDFVALNAPVEVKLSGVTEQKFTFVSLVDTVITITTVGELDTCGALYDANGKLLLKGDDVSIANKNFKLTHQVKAGEAYTIVVYGYGEAVEGTTVLHVSGYDTVSAGGKAYLSNLRVVSSGETYELPVPEARPGYTFLGWADENNVMYTNALGIGLTAWATDSDVVLHDIWQENA